MEILSDATFKGSVIISGGDFYVKYPGKTSHLIETNSIGEGILIRGTETIYGDLSLGDPGGPANIISNWSDLNNILDFAQSCTVSSLSSTVSSNTSKINSACSTISSLCTTVNSLCTTVACIQPNTKHVFGSPKLPAGCTKFYFVNNVMCAGGDDGNKHYKFILNKWYDPVSSVQVFKGGTGLGSTDVVNEEVQMDVKQYTTRCSTYGSKRYFEATLASNTSGYDESEFLLVFDDFGVMCTTSIVPQ